MHLDDPVRLRHMVDAAVEAQLFVADKSRSDLDLDRMRSLALIRCIEVIGEAANGISEELRVIHTEIPWGQIVAMRNRLIHGYFDIDLDRLWDTVTVDLPLLITQIKPLVESI